ncbi:hypothetical protein SLA2020_430190 [Shorea laevis]
MSGPQCCSNSPTLDPSAVAGHVVQLGGLSTYVSGSPDSNLAILLISNVFGYETPNLRKIADKVAAAGFYVVVPDSMHGEPFSYDNADRPLPVWLKDHGTDKGFEEAKPIIEAVKSQGVSAVGAAGFVGVPRFVDDIKGVKVPIAILGAQIDEYSPPELLKQFEEVLTSKSKVDSYVKVFPNTEHGWTLGYNVEDEAAVKSAEKAHHILLEWCVKYVK